MHIQQFVEYLFTSMTSNELWRTIKNTNAILLMHISNQLEFINEHQLEFFIDECAFSLLKLRKISISIEHLFYFECTKL